MKIEEDEENSRVIIDGIVIQGYIDQSVCGNCNQKKIYHSKYDAYFCPNCNVWLEHTCSAYDCEFCRNRPEKPLDPQHR